MHIPDTLNLAYTTEAPTLDEYDIKHQETREFFDRVFTLTVIGDSHYIGCADLAYHELLTCKPLDEKEPASDSPEQQFWTPNGLMKTVPLVAGYSETLRHVVNRVGITTELAGQPLSEFGNPDEYDIAYKFGADAYTTIDLLDDTTYETYHTYPEYDVALRTVTSFTPLTSEFATEREP